MRTVSLYPQMAGNNYWYLNGTEDFARMVIPMKKSICKGSKEGIKHIGMYSSIMEQFTERSMM